MLVEIALPLQKNLKNAKIRFVARFHAWMWLTAELEETPARAKLFAISADTDNHIQTPADPRENHDNRRR